MCVREGMGVKEIVTQFMFIEVFTRRVLVDYFGPVCAVYTWQLGWINSSMLQLALYRRTCWMEMEVCECELMENAEIRK